ncbi:tenascin [Musca domestica]|uniref:Tenascin n=1 Tax=Musca domestica TaxID=7370 RepID=A0A9J7DNL8_MUSDO|nr:tenascin [Musca domestica]
MFLKILIFLLVLNRILSQRIPCLENDIECHKLLAADGNCVESQCSDFMECGPSNKCQCKTAFREYFDGPRNISRCVFYLPSACGDDMECGPLAQCSLDERNCHCMEGYQMVTLENELRQFCEELNNGREEVQPKCSPDYVACFDKCCGLGVECSEEGECGCGQGLVTIYNEENRTLSCELENANQITCPEDCPLNSQCREGECKCEEGFEGVTMDGKFSCRLEIICRSGHTKCFGKCCPPNAECVEGNCICPKGFVESKDPLTNNLLCVKLEKPTTKSSIGFLDDIFNFENFCQNSRNKCSKSCCKTNAHCNEKGECVCRSSRFVERHTKVMKAKYCEELPRTYDNLIYMSLGGVCILVALLVLCAKCCLYFKKRT